MQPRLTLILLSLLLAACAPVMTSAQSNAVEMENTAVVIAKTSVALTQMALPSVTFTTPPPTAAQVESTPSPIPTLYPKFPLDGYILIFQKDGDLYFQIGDNAPIQLTHEKGSSFLALSNDNEKVIFTHANNISVINTDGSHERVIITADWLTSFGVGTKIVNLVFIPGTQKVLFNTFRCESQKRSVPCLIGLFQVDVETGTIKEILLPGEIGQLDSAENFKVSPNGKMIAVGLSGYAVLLDINGNFIRRDILPYTPSTSNELLPLPFWLPDSSGLILAIPDKLTQTHAYGDVSAYSIWRYVIESNQAVAIPLDPYPMNGNFQVSPDGNWILYGGKSTDESIYLGNLSTGQTRVLDEHGWPDFFWSPNSKYFLSGQILGSVDGQSILLSKKGVGILGWLNTNCLIYVDDLNGINTYIAEISENGIQRYILEFDKDVEIPLLIKLK